MTDVAALLVFCQRDGHHSFTSHVMGILILPVTPTYLEGDTMFGGLAAGFAHLVRPTKTAQGLATDRRPIKS